MSSDTGIYVAKFSDGYRVTGVVQAIENIDYYPKGSVKRKGQLQNYFGNSEIFPTEEEAFFKAIEIRREYEKDEEDFGMGCPVEYGISYIGEYEDF